jgi:lysyl-tRNA synthetase, class II
MPTLDELKQVRLDKLTKLQQAGIDPYPSAVRRTHTIGAARQMEGKLAEVTGRIIAKRGHGKIFFFDIQDEAGKIQIVIKSDTCDPKGFALMEYLDIADFVSVQGMVGKTQAGEISIFATDLQIITKTLLPLPDQWHGLKDVEERYRKRYLDTILNEDVRKRLFARSRVIDALRDFLTDRGFLEVETPTLQPIYGGGFARPFVTHHNELDADFYLRISDEMYLKRMIVGGFDRVFEITKVFRNEGVDHDHNPEFTMFEAQIAYEDYSYGMDIIEEIIEYIALQVFGKTTFTYQGKEIEVKRPWTRMKMVEAVQKFTGIDPLQWKTLDEAKTAIQGIEEIKDEKFKDLAKMHSIGECIAFVFEECVEEKLIQPTIIYDYPIENSPLAKKCADPRFTQRFEMFAFGSELGNNYTELNDPVDLRKRFVEEKKREEAGFDEAHQTDYDYLTAIEHGFPPTCGIAIGIDRLVMMLTDAKSIKEVIPFPTLRPESPVAKQSEKKQKKAVEKTDPAHTMSREKAIELLHMHTKNENLRRHMYAVGYAMRALAQKLGGDPDTWEVLGLLHDADWEMTKEAPEKHTKETLAWLKDLGIIEGPLVHALMSHNRKYTQLAELDGIMEWALETVDELTGFIVAVTLIRPEKRLAGITVDIVMKKWNQKAFAAAVEREQIAQCEEKLGIPLSEFVQITLSAMQAHHEELGL